MNLTANIVTRGRPETLCRTIRQTLSNIRHPNTSLLVSVDNDDYPTIDALTSSDMRELPFLMSIEDREDSIGAKHNRALDYEADVYLPMVDYRPITTPGFDFLILDCAQLFPDGIGCVYTHKSNRSFPEYQAITAGLASQMGFIYPPWFPYWFVDHWVHNIARLIGRIGDADIRTECLPRGFGTQEFREIDFWTRFFDAGAYERKRTAEAIIDAPEFLTPDWEKALLRRRWTRVESDSLWTTAQARRENATTPEAPPDARYARIKIAAKARMLEWLRAAGAANIEYRSVA